MSDDESANNSSFELVPVPTPPVIGRIVLTLDLEVGHFREMVGKLRGTGPYGGVWQKSFGPAEIALNRTERL